MMIWLYAGIIAIAFVIQFILSSRQMSQFNKEFVALRRKGKVVVGRKSGGFFAGAIVMFQIDDNGVIQESKKIEGTTFLAKVKDFPGFEGIYVRDLNKEMIPKSHKNLRKAVEDAALTYKKFVSGEPIPDAPSPAQKLRLAIARNKSES